MYVYVDFKTFVSIILNVFILNYFKSALTLNLGYRKPPRCVGAISQI